MSRKINDGEAAFPLQMGSETTFRTNGMTLRDYFAAKALQGLITDDYWARSSVETAKKAYRFADAMIEERGDL
jgi:hypothetical protein